MTVIAWDGKTLAADKRAVNGGLVGTTTKIFHVSPSYGPPAVLAYTGDACFGEQMVAWWLKGASQAEFPPAQRDSETWSRLVVATFDVDTPIVYSYERTPFPVRLSDKYQAWGSGRDFALMAMHCGRSAVEAVLSTAFFDSGCGNGFDAFTFSEGEIIPCFE